MSRHDVQYDHDVQQTVILGWISLYWFAKGSNEYLTPMIRDRHGKHDFDEYGGFSN